MSNIVSNLENINFTPPFTVIANNKTALKKYNKLTDKSGGKA
jgi:hypothetical protein